MLIGVVARRQIEETVSQQMLRTAERTTNRLDHGLFERYRDIQIASTLLSSNELSTVGTRTLINTLQETYTDYSWIGLADQEGTVLISTGQILEGADVSMRPWFSVGLERPFIGDVHDAILLQPYVSPDSTEPLRLIDISFPVVDTDGNSVGVLGAHLNWLWVEEVHDTLLTPLDLERKIEAFVLSEEGQILFSTEGVEVTLPADILEQIQSNQQGVITTTWADNQQYVSGLVHTNGYRTYPGLGWTVLVRQPTAVAFAPAQQMSRQILISGILLGAVFAIFGWVLAGWIVYPIQQLAAATQEIKPGNQVITMPRLYSYQEAVTLSDALYDLLVKLNREIYERNLSNEALQDSKAELQHVINSVPEGVLLLTNEGHIRLANPIADQFISILAPERLDGRITHLGNRPLADLFTSPPKGLWHEIAANNMIFEAIARPVETTAKTSGWVLVLRDITQERAIQQRAQRQDRLAVIGQLAAGVAHDFNNILAVITLYAQLILRSPELPDATQQRLTTIEQQTKRAADLIQQILDFGRQSVMERRTLDLLPLMKEQVKLLDRTLPGHIQIDCHYDAEKYLIKADPSRIQQVIMNLAVNARDAMPSGGRLQFALTHTHFKTDAPQSMIDMPPGKWVQVQIADSGTGIPPEVLTRIFEPFFTTKEVGKGTGLGLAQVYGIVKQHEGFVDVTSVEGQGTTFTLFFPTAVAEEEALAILSNGSVQQGQGQIILIVEDNPAIRAALVDSLTLLNYNVLAAQNGREALQILTTRHHDITLVLSDAVMPQLGGVALIHAMREHNYAIPVILLTGHPLGQERENLQSLGLAGWLKKPPNLEQLSQAIARALA